jgi:hypothetical protein
MSKILINNRQSILLQTKLFHLKNENNYKKRRIKRFKIKFKKTCIIYQKKTNNK